MNPWNVEDNIKKKKKNAQIALLFLVRKKSNPAPNTLVMWVGIHNLIKFQSWNDNWENCLFLIGKSFNKGKWTKKKKILNLKEILYKLLRIFYRQKVQDNRILQNIDSFFLRYYYILINPLFSDLLKATIKQT